VDQDALVTEEINAGAQFLAEFDTVVPIAVAFWLKTSHRKHWTLFVASGKITDDNYDKFYDDVGDILQKMDNPDLDILRVRLIGIDHPIAHDLLENIRLGKGRIPRNYSGQLLVGTTVEGIHVYPSPITVPVA